MLLLFLQSCIWVRQKEAPSFFFFLHAAYIWIKKAESVHDFISPKWKEHQSKLQQKAGSWGKTLWILTCMQEWRGIWKHPKVLSLSPPYSWPGLWNNGTRNWPRNNFPGVWCWALNRSDWALCECAHFVHELQSSSQVPSESVILLLWKWRANLQSGLGILRTDGYLRLAVAHNTLHPSIWGAAAPVQGEIFPVSVPSAEQRINNRQLFLEVLFENLFWEVIGLT